jgi:hypothetical protein
MKTFTIDEQKNITAFATKDEAAGTSGLVFSSQKELAKLATDWPIGRFIEIWNGFAGVAPFGELKPVKKFTDRKTAVSRIWQALQKLHAEVLPASVPETEAKPGPEAGFVQAEAAEVPPTEVAKAAPDVASVAEPASATELSTVAPQVPDVAPEVAAATTGMPAPPTTRPPKP